MPTTQMRKRRLWDRQFPPFTCVLRRVVWHAKAFVRAACAVCSHTCVGRSGRCALSLGDQGPLCEGRFDRSYLNTPMSSSMSCLLVPAQYNAPTRLQRADASEWGTSSWGNTQSGTYTTSLESPEHAGTAISNQMGLVQSTYDFSSHLPQIPQH